jgi:hypothetical protein
MLEFAAHTISQRLRQLKKIPVELLPIGMRQSFAMKSEGLIGL